jgi:hypothetical protein
MHAQEQGMRGLEGNWYPFSLKHFRSSFRHELGVSFFSHFYRSPDLAVHYEVMDGVAYPEPVYNRGIGLMSLHYEPRFRLLEYRHWASITLDIPLVWSLSLVDLTTEDGFRYSADTVSTAAFNAGIFSVEREAGLGLTHLEAGAMLSLNLWQGATYENTFPLGVSMGLGVHRLFAPGILNFIAGYTREQYQEYTSWWTPVSRLSLHYRGVVLSYTIGVNPVLVYYESLNSKRAVYTNTYNRFSLSLRLGR